MAQEISQPMQRSLDELGVKDGELSNDEKRELDEQGYVRFECFVDPKHLEAIRAKTEALLLAEGNEAGNEMLSSGNIKHPKEQGATRLANLVNKGDEFELLFTHPKLLAAVAHVLKADFKLSSMNYRAALPGKGEQNLHVDWKSAVGVDQFCVCNSIWLLDDFTAKNGATRLVPASHLEQQVPGDVMADTAANHPKEVLLEAKAGTVVVFNAHIWHGGTRNCTDRPRRAIHSYFCRRDQPQQLNQRDFISTETLARLSDAAKFILEVS